MMIVNPYFFAEPVSVLLFFDFDNNLDNTGSTPLAASFPSIQTEPFATTLGVTGVNIGASPKADYVSLVLDNDLEMGANDFRFTISCIFKGLGGIQTLYYSGASDATHELIDIQYYSNTIYFHRYTSRDGASEKTVQTSGVPAFAIDVLYEIIVEYIAGRTYIKVNGVTYANSSTPFTVNTLKTTQTIGKYGSSSNRMNGVINEFKLEMI